MKMVKTKLALGAAIAALALSAGTANAAVTFSSVGFDQAPGPGETMIATFDAPIAAGYSISGGAVAPGSIPNTAAAPAGDATAFYYVIGDGMASLTAPTYLHRLSIYIGSLDDYNTIVFKRDGVTVASFDGLALQIPANGDQGDPATNRRFTFNFTAGDEINGVQFLSDDNSFEFDNIAVSAVPEPGVWALMISGFGMLGAALRRRRSVAIAAA